MKKSIAIITARGGSKRIPGKNIRLFCGKPIIAYSIEAAINCSLFDTIMVSTDSVDISDIAKRYGADVPFLRSKETAGDNVGTADVLVEVLERYKSIGIEFDDVCCIYPTAPFVTSTRIIDSYKLLYLEDVYDVVTMVRFSFPPQRGLLINEYGFIEPLSFEGLKMRSQDLPIIYHDAGQLYWLKTREFLERRELIGTRTKPYIVSEIESQDIDNESDWSIAEIKYKYINNVS